MTSIGKGAFYRVPLESLTLGSSLVTIEEKAFYYAKITTLVIPDSVTSIGDYAFGYTSSLTTLTLGSSLETIGDYAFIIAPITSLVIPDSVTSIGEGAFINAPLESLTLGSSLVTIGKEAFSGTSIVELSIPDSVVTIGPFAFQKCQSLSSLTLGNSVEEIGKYAFYYNDVTALVIPDSVVTIGDSAFAVTDIATLTIGKGLRDLHEDAFINSSQLATVTIDAENPYFKAVDNVIYSKDGTKLYYYPEGIGTASFTFPDGVTELSNTINNNHLESVCLCADLTTLCEHPFNKTTIEITVAPGNESFSAAGGCLLSADGKDLKYVFASVSETFNVPEGVVTIDPYTLWSKNMTEVVLPDTVTTIGAYAFGYCNSLTTVSGGNVTHIGENAFSMCNNLTSFEFAEGVETIGDAAFCYTGFTTLTIVGAVNATIGNQAFATTEHLTSLNISGGFAIGDYAFKDVGKNGGDRLTVSVTLGSGIRSIGHYAFQNVAITSLVIPDSVTTIGNYAFEDSGIVSLTIGEGVTSISSYAFSGCSVTSMHFNAVSCGDFDSDLRLGWSVDPEAVITVEIGEKVQRIPAQFASYDNGLNITSIELPASVKEIAKYAFYKCSALETLVLSSGLQTIGYSSFQGCTGISTLTIPESVTSIGSVAFQGCTGLTSVTFNAANCVIESDNYEPFEGSGVEGGMAVTIGNSVKSILKSLFRASNAGPTVTLPEGVLSIGNYAFYQCPKIVTVAISSSVTDMGWSSFSGCPSLETINYNAKDIKEIDSSYPVFGSSGSENPGISVVIGSSVLSVPSYLMDDAVGVKQVTLGESVTSIGERAFYGCPISVITIPSKVESIGSYAFFMCDSLTTINYNAASCELGYSVFYRSDEAVAGRSVSIGDDVVDIPESIFNDDPNLVSVTLGAKVATIGTSAFAFAKITTLTIPASVTSMGGSCFANCTSLATIIFSATNCTKAANAFDSSGPESGITVTVSDGVVKLPEDIFEDVAHVKSISLPDTLVTIGAGALYRTNISSVTIPDSVTSIGDNAFSGCHSLASVTIGEGVEEIGTGAFDDLTALASLAYNAVDAEIAGALLSPEGASISLTLGPKVEKIPDYAFNCTRIAGSIIIPDTVTEIGEDAFYGSTGITSVVLGDKVASIGNRAFYNCSGITELTIGSADLAIGESAFYNCSGITALTIPSNVKSIGSYAFSGMTGLTEVVFNASFIGEADSRIIGDSAPGCRVTFGDGVTSIPVNLFRGCANLETVVFNDDITEIGSRAFCDTGVTSLVFPDTLTTIGNYAFEGCHSLTSVTIPQSVTSIGLSFNGLTFHDTNDNYLSQTVQNLSGHVFSGDGGLLTMVPYGFTFNTLGGTDVSERFGIPGTSVTPAVEAPEKEHYTFAWWCSDEACTEKYIISNYPDSHITLYAKWTPDTYTVTFDLNGGSPAVDPKEVTYPNPVPAPEGPFTKTGYTFADWLLGGYHYDFSSVVERDITLTADWSANYYTVTLDGTPAADGSASIRFMDVMHDYLSVGINPGYTLLGFFTEQESGHGVKVIDAEYQLVPDIDGYTDAEGHWIKAENVTLYAQWSPKQYTFPLDENGGNAPGTATFTFGTAVVTDFTPVTRTGYTCTGYYVGSMSGVCVLSAEGVLQPSTNYTDEHGKWSFSGPQQTLYAKWEANTVAITLDGNGYGSEPGSATATYDSSAVTVTGDASRPGWILTGYYSAADAGVLVLSTEGELSPSTLYTDAEGNWTGTSLTATLYAHWSPVLYTITLKGIDSDGSATVRSGDTEFSIIEVPTLIGNKVANYCATPGNVQVTDAAGNLLPNVSGFTNELGEWIYIGDTALQLSASWTTKTYDIVLERNGGNADGAATVNYANDRAFVDPHVSRTGYTLTGYFIGSTKVINPDGTLEANVTDYTDEYGNWSRDGGATFAAGWAPESYTVTLDKNTGDGDNVDVTVTFDTAVVDGYSAISKRGCTLTGYWTAESGGIKVLNDDGTLVFNVLPYTDASKWVKAEDVILYAQWAPNAYSVVLDGNGAGAVNGSAVAVFGAPLSSLSDAVREGYVLTGYFTAATDGTKVINANGTLVADVDGYTAGTNWDRADDCRLYAQWTAGSYTVTYKVNGGETLVEDTLEVTYGQPYTLVTPTNSDPAKHFAGWKDAHDSIYSMTGTWSTAGDVTLTAQWADTENFEIKFIGGDGAVGQPFSEFVANGNIISLPANPFTKEGHHFVDWLVGEAHHDTGSSYTVTAAVTFEAVWAADQYEVKYMLDGAELTDDYAPAQHAFGTQVNVLAVFSKTGYEVTAWSTLGADVQDGVFTMPAADVVFSATSTALSYEVTISGNGAEGTRNVTVTFDSSTVSVFQPFARTGYTLLGYFSGEIKVISAAGTLEQNAAEFTAEGKWNRAGNAELQAKWQANSQTIVLDKNGGDTDGSATVTFDSSDVTSFTAVERTGYTLNGFFTAATDGTKVMNADGTLVKGISGYTDSNGKWIDDSFGKLYAQWTAIQYTLNLRDGATSKILGHATVYYGAVSAEITDIETSPGKMADYYTVLVSGAKVMNADGSFVKNVDGYTDSEGRWILADEYIVLGTITKAIRYDLVLDKNEGESDGEALTYYGNLSANKYVNTPPVRAHYDIDGYYTAPSGGQKVMEANWDFVKGVDGYTDADGKWNRESGCTLYTHWQIQSHQLTIHYVYTDSSEAHCDYVQELDYGQAYNVMSPTITGYTPDKATASGTMGDEDIVITVTYAVNQYTISFDSHGGTAVAPIVQDYNTAVSAPADPTKDGYDFKEWQLNGEKYEFTTMPAEDIELDAIWTVHQYTITYELYGGTNAPGNPASYTIETSTFQLADATRTGYDFGGWYLDSGFTEPITQVVYGSFGDKHLYAQWTAHVYSLTLTSTGASDGSATVTYLSDEIAYLVDAKVTGYNVVGYNTEGGVLVIDDERHLVASVEGYTDADGRWIRAQDTVLTPATVIQVHTLTINYEFSAGGTAAEQYVGQFEYGQAYDIASPAVTGYTPGDTKITGTMGEANVEKAVLYTVNQYTITFSGNGGSPAGVVQELGYGAPVVAPDDPEREGFVFKGWDQPVPATMPAENITLTAVWSAKPVSPSAEVIEFDDPVAETVVIDKYVSEVTDALNNGSKTVVDVKGDGWTMEIPKDIITGATGNVSAGAKALSDEAKAALPDSVKEKIQGKTVFSLDLKDGNGNAITFTGTKVKVSLPYALKDGENADRICMYYIDAENKAVRVDATYDSASMCVVFETDHFSTWFVDFDAPASSGGGNNTMIIVGVVIAIAAVLGIFGYLIITGKLQLGALGKKQ